MLSMWLHDNRTNNWLLGLNFVKFAKNTWHHSGIGDAPSTVVYDQQEKLVISTLPLRADFITNIEREQDLERVLNNIS